MKGLEPEIQRIVEKNKEEIRKLQELHDADIRAKRNMLTEEVDSKY